MIWLFKAPLVWTYSVLYIVSWDTCKSLSESVCMSQPAICCGDQVQCNFIATNRANTLFKRSLHLFGLFAGSLAAVSALFALYDPRPPFRFTSLDTVEGARFSCFAISRIDNCDDRPRDISSLQSNASNLSKYSVALTDWTHSEFRSFSLRHSSIEDPSVIQKILSHLNTKNDEVVELLPP